MGVVTEHLDLTVSADKEIRQTHFDVRYIEYNSLFCGTYPSAVAQNPVIQATIWLGEKVPIVKTIVKRNDGGVFIS